ncbi:MAG: phosphofructokinase [Chloroflexi bacterium]|jgi:6-phosphofructokinase 1|nr:phosphofructokinase [Chloroflexota bacterium]
MSKRVAILTGGGDVPGLNMCLKSLVYRVIDLGYEPIGVRKGWEGLMQHNPRDPSTFSQQFIELTKNRVRSIDQTPGSFLHSSRIDPRDTPVTHVPGFLSLDRDENRDLTEHIISVVEHLGLDGVVVLGDDDTLRYAAYLCEKGLPIVAIPKTIHNNIRGTDYTLGFSTGLARGVDFIHQLRALAGSREQIIVVETFGDHSGYSALLIAYLADVDRVLIPEVPYDPKILAYLVSQDKHMTPSNYAIVTVTNGARVAPDKLAIAQEYLSSYNYAEILYGEETGAAATEWLHSSGLIAAELLQNLTGEEVFFQQLSYLMRTGTPDGQDLLGATNFGLTAAQLLREGKFGRMTAFQRHHTWTHIDLVEAAQEEKMVDIDAWYDAKNYKSTDGLIWSVSNG